ncbi:Phenylalanine--tRNA ligase alpha subunit [Oopsacas minuta]|uniref:phenylalanine--tRNA ligase n=1 Tax=Oopsacas minuta TaxID=111878 RepID=A0AAV7JSX9_9METZ|nr:Phenylalanine--tRNA ligase alpha subunit [Oopsacas minuta]
MAVKSKPKMTLQEGNFLALVNEKNITSLLLATQLDIDHQDVIGIIKSIQSLGDVIRTEQMEENMWTLTQEGNGVLERGSHEFMAYNFINPDQGTPQQELMKSIPNAKVGFNKAMSLGWIRIEKVAGIATVFRNVDTVTDNVQQVLQMISTGNIASVGGDMLKNLKGRKLIVESLIKSYFISKGDEFMLDISPLRLPAEITAAMLASNAWKQMEFKPLNLRAKGNLPQGGHLHPLLKGRAQMRQIFIEMGFSEMPTNNFVECSFWNFDALFQPQQHPARDAHDTFFISDPPLTTDLPQEYVERVKRVHESGGYGSTGYKYDWKIGEAQKNILRTHTTAVSARMLYKLAQDGFKPAKYFSIDRVFRNETMDSTHLVEFHQVEGVVADYNLTLGHLIGIFAEFFKKLGIEKLRFKPAYNPYTEPSLEIFGYHEGNKTWIEVGNSGVFRPEMLLPMGLPKDVVVLAWGLSLERPIMIKYGFDNIRKLVGHKQDMEMIYNNPICRLDF